MLEDFGFYKGEVDSFFGPMTEQGVKDFQSTSTVLQANGIVDEQTRAELYKQFSFWLEHNVTPLKTNSYYLTDKGTQQI